MIPEDTTFITKVQDKKALVTDKFEGESAFCGISIRAWLALIVICSMCIINILVCFVSLYISHTEYVIDPQFWMLCGIILTHFFSKSNNPAPPANTVTNTTIESQTKTP